MKYVLLLLISLLTVSPSVGQVKIFDGLGGPISPNGQWATITRKVSGDMSMVNVHGAVANIQYLILLNLSSRNEVILKVDTTWWDTTQYTNLTMPESHSITHWLADNRRVVLVKRTQDKGFPTTNSTYLWDISSYFSSSKVIQKESTPIAKVSAYNAPNPFNPSTLIHYTIPEEVKVFVGIYNTHGALIQDVFNGQRQTGEYTYLWDGASYASGTYYLKIHTDAGRLITKKMILLK